MQVESSHLVLNRIDAVVLEINSSESVRENTIKIISGVPLSGNPSKPSLVKDYNNKRWQYPLAYITVNAGVTHISNSNITNCVGQSDCPYVTAPLQTVSIDTMVKQWDSQFNEWFASLEETLSGDVAATLADQILKLKRRDTELANQILELQKHAILDSSYS